MAGGDTTRKRNQPMDLHLSGDLERLVREKVDRGLYRSADEVISEALHVLDERDQGLDARATTFREEIEKRLASGPATPLDFDEIRQRIRGEVEVRQSERR
jgi:antitoxin ParD1/3/4